MAADHVDISCRGGGAYTPPQADAALAVDDVFHLLRTERRRWLIRAVASEGEVRVPDFADRVSNTVTGINEGGEQSPREVLRRRLSEEAHNLAAADVLATETPDERKKGLLVTAGPRLETVATALREVESVVSATALSLQQAIYVLDNRRRRWAVRILATEGEMLLTRLGATIAGSVDGIKSDGERPPDQRVIDSLRYRHLDILSDAGAVEFGQRTHEGWQIEPGPTAEEIALVLGRVEDILSQEGDA